MKKTILFLGLLLLSVFGFATIINIPIDCSSIQAGINVAIDSDTVLVASGTYFENINYNGKNISVIGEDMETTIIDGNQNGHVVSFASFYSGEDSTAILSGFTITNGRDVVAGGIRCSYNSNPSIENVTITGNIAEHGGGGIYCYDSSPSLKNVIIIDNCVYWGWGGGIHCNGNSFPSLENVTITSNSAYFGGGIVCRENSSLNFSVTNRCDIYSNTVRNSRGCGMDIFVIDCNIIDVVLDTFTVITPTDYYASPINFFTFDIIHSLKDSLINADVYVSVNGNNSNSGISPDEPFKTINHALSVIYSDSLNVNTIHLSHGVYDTTNGETFPIEWNNYVNLSGNYEGETILDANQTACVMAFHNITDCSINDIIIKNGNAIPFVGYWGSGGGFYLSNSSPCIENVIIAQNNADYGGGIYCEKSSPILNNVTITDNIASTGGSIYCIGESNPSLMNCILWNNTPQEIYIQSGSITVNYSDIEGGWTGIENINANPLFVNPASEDYHITVNSPCINAGDPTSPLDPDGTRADMGAYFYYHSHDFSASPRFGNNQLSVNFSDLSEGAVSNWEWDFDNDGVLDSFEQNPFFLYNQPGLYDVKFVIQRTATWKDTLIKENYIVIQELNLDTPQNPTITKNENDIILSWDAVVDADYYLIYKSDDPYNDFEYLDYTTAITSYTHTDVISQESKLFYIIIGFDGTMERLNEFIELNKIKKINVVSNK